jgi:membrane protein YqaA with SNARE-associated domain
VQLIHEGLEEIRPYVEAYGVWALFLVLYLESLGAPLPGESALVASAFLASTGELLLTPVVLASFIGAVAGDSTGYMIGRAGGRPLLLKFGPKLGLTPERLQRVERLFERRGVWVVLTARFVVLFRSSPKSAKALCRVGRYSRLDRRSRGNSLADNLGSVGADGVSFPLTCRPAQQVTHSRRT